MPNYLAGKFARIRHILGAYWQQLLIGLMVLVGLVVISFFVGGRDYQPPLWALQIELSGGSAYGEAMDARFRSDYDEPFASGGFAYPLPAMWLALPLIVLPGWAIGPVWCVLEGGSVLVGLLLLRMPRSLLFFLPLPLGFILQQGTVLLVGLLLIGVWAWQERRWWLLSAIVALTIAAKPQTTLLVAGVLALLALREGAWYPLLVCGLVVALPTFALEPTWIPQWFAAVERYRMAIGMYSVWQWVPVALLLLFLRQYWSGLAVLQVALFPTLFGYTLLPLLVGYVDPAVRRFALLGVAGSWVSVLLVRVQPGWLFIGLCYLGPMVIGGIWEKKGPVHV